MGKPTKSARDQIIIAPTVYNRWMATHPLLILARVGKISDALDMHGVYMSIKEARIFLVFLPATTSGKSSYTSGPHSSKPKHQNLTDNSNNELKSKPFVCQMPTTNKQHNEGNLGTYFRLKGNRVMPSVNLVS